MVDRDMVSYYETLSAMKDRNFTITELEEMIPYEFDFYLMIETEKVRAEKERLKNKQ